MIGYKTEWIEMDKNEEFWKEVMVGRTIESLTFDDSGITSFILDSGEEIFVPLGGSRLFIECDDGKPGNADV